MRWRLVALLLLGLNLLVLAGWLTTLSHLRRVRQEGQILPPTPEVSASTQTNLVVRRQFFSWREVESPDYVVYVNNLRDIGCPEQTIRDIIIADVNALYARRLATELVTAGQQWWRSEPDQKITLLAAEKRRELDEERRTLLTKLLGPSWEARDLTSLPRPSRQGVSLDGPILGQLSAEVQEAVQEISLRSEDRMQAYVESQLQAGLDPDPAELARLRQQTREELARVLSPQPLEEFLLRYSQAASNWRSLFGELKFFNPSAEEFRAVFRATDTIDQRLESLGSGSDPGTIAARKALEDQREQALRIALGPKRYQEYQMLHDPLYRDAVAAAAEAGNPESARTLYQLNLAAAEEFKRIQDNPILTARQKEIELRQAALDQLRAETLATGQDLPPEPPSSPPMPPRRTYTVRTGDTLSVMSMIHGVPINAIKAANPNVDFSRLRPGDVINVPRTMQTAPGP